MVSPKPLLKELTASGLRVDWPGAIVSCWTTGTSFRADFFSLQQAKCIFFFNYCLLFKAGKTMAAKGFPDDVMCST